MSFGFHSVYTTFAAIIIGIAVLYGGVILLMYMFQASMIYLPERKMVANPGEIGLPFEKVYFESNDGVQLFGWFVPAEDTRGVVLFCHGNAGNISHRLDMLRILHRLGMSTFLFDYRGYGKSGGKPSELGTYDDTAGALRWVTERCGLAPHDIIMLGRSLGGAIAVHTAYNSPPRMLIIDSSFTSVTDLARELYPWAPVKHLMRFKYSTERHLENIACPVLIIHSTDDDLVPFSHGKRLFDRAREPKEFLEITGGHNNGYLVSEEHYAAGLDSFLSRY